MFYTIVQLGTDYKGKITDFSKARNSFIEHLGNNSWILFIDNDAEPTKMLLDYLNIFNPPPEAKYYSIRTINLINNQYSPLHNPFFWRVLVSNKVRYVGALHEKILEEPTGIIDFPIIHNHIKDNYDMIHSYTGNIRLAVKKVKDILLKGHYDTRVV